MVASHLHRTRPAIFAMFGRLHVSMGQARLMQNRPPSQAELARKFRPFPRACIRACTHTSEEGLGFSPRRFTPAFAPLSPPLSSLLRTDLAAPSPREHIADAHPLHAEVELSSSHPSSICPHPSRIPLISLCYCFLRAFWSEPSSRPWRRCVLELANAREKRGVRRGSSQRSR